MSKKNTKKTISNRSIIQFPTNLLKPVTEFLSDRLKKLNKTKKDLTKEDPFSNKGRVDNNASPDTDAEEQYGHARVSAIKDELSKKIIQTKKALAMIRLGKYGVCEDCGQMIDTDRLMIYPETTLCANDAKKREN